MLNILFFPFALAGSIFSWIFALFGLLIGFIFALLGRVFSLVLGLLLCVGGVASCLSVIGLFLGLPMLVLGGALVLRSVF